MNIEHLKLFVRLASTHNISMAGQELGLSPAVASSHISKLEDNLGARLVHRTTRKVSLTEEGEAFLPHAEEVLSSVDAAKSAVGVGCDSPIGTLRVTASASFGRLHLVPALPGFLDRYPGLKVDLRLSDSMVDLVEGGFDIAIRISELKDSTLIARKLARDKRVVCASPDYLIKYGNPAKPQDLNDHQCISLIGLENWIFNTENGPKTIKASGSLRADNGEALRDAAIGGLGITVTSNWCAYEQLKNGQLIKILEDYSLTSEPAIWAVYPSSRLIAPKVRAFIDYFSEYYGNPPYWEQK
ncbi:LysR family transcriptional regulator [Vibrio cyclitrophicus]